MLSNKEMNKDIHDMKMSEIEAYVNELKDTIYHLTSTMQTISSSFKDIESDLKQFNSLKINKKNASQTKKIVPVKQPMIEEEDEEVLNESEEIEEVIPEVNENEFIIQESLNDFHPNTNNYSSDDDSVEEGPFIVQINFIIERNSTIHNMIVGLQTDDFLIKAFEPDEYHELIDQVGFDPRFYWDNIPDRNVINSFWKNFITTFAKDTFPLETLKIVNVEYIDRFHHKEDIPM